MTYRELISDKMKEFGESFNSVQGYIGDPKELDLPIHKSVFEVNEIRIYVYTENYVYFPYYIPEYGIQTHVFIQHLPLPNNPEFKNLVW